jgi:beta-lactamase regulating signal transducer with metallopeptidase domain
VSGVIEIWASWLALASVHACGLMALAMIVERVLGRRMRASLQTVLWSAVLLRLVIPPVPESWTIAAVTAPWTPEAAVPWYTREATGPQATVGTRELLFAVWMLGAFASAALALRSHRRSLRGMKRDGANVPASMRSAAEAAARDLGLARIPRLAAGQSRTPHVIGAFRPVVVLPASLQDAGPVVLRHVLLHEFAHVKRCDTLAALVSLILQVVYWFHPGVWIAARRVSTCRELACDALAARAAGSAAEYRRTLLDLARPLAAVPAGVGLFGAGELITRLVALESEVVIPSRGQRISSAIAGALLLGASAAAVGYARPVDLAALDPSAAGCLRLRYAVYAMLAREAAANEGSR